MTTEDEPTSTSGGQPLEEIPGQPPLVSFSQPATGAPPAGLAGAYVETKNPAATGWDYQIIPNPSPVPESETETGAQAPGSDTDTPTVPTEETAPPEAPVTPDAWLVVDDTLDVTGHCRVSGTGLRDTDGVPVRESTPLVLVVDGQQQYHVLAHGLEGEYQTAISVQPGAHRVEIINSATGTVLAARDATIT